MFIFRAIALLTGMALLLAVQTGIASVVGGAVVSLAIAPIAEEALKRICAGRNTRQRLFAGVAFGVVETALIAAPISALTVMRVIMHAVSAALPVWQGVAAHAGWNLLMLAMRALTGR